MIRNPVKLALASIAISMPLPICAEPADLDPIAATAEIGQVSQLQYDSSTGALLGVAGSKLISIDLTAGTTARVAQLGGEIVALALDQEAGVAGTLTADNSTISLISVGDGTTVGQIDSAVESPGAMTVDGSTGQFVGASSSIPELTLVPVDGTSVRKVQLPGPASQLVANSRGWLFATAADRRAVYVVDTERGTSLGQFPVSGCEGPRSPIIDDVERRLYVACSNGLLVAIDSDTGVVLGRIPIPKNAVDMALAGTSGRIINIIVATRDGLWLASGRITAQNATRLTESLDGVSALARGPDDSVFVVHDQTISRLRR